jgi:hypothetical protein
MGGYPDFLGIPIGRDKTRPYRVIASPDLSGRGNLMGVGDCFTSFAMTKRSNDKKRSVTRVVNKNAGLIKAECFDRAGEKSGQGSYEYT